MGGRLLLKEMSGATEPGPSSCSSHGGEPQEGRLASADPLPSVCLKLPCTHPFVLSGLPETFSSWFDVSSGTEASGLRWAGKNEPTEFPAVPTTPETSLNPSMCPCLTGGRAWGAPGCLSLTGRY